MEHGTLASAGDASAKPFGRLEDGRPAQLLLLRAAGIAATVCDYGATLVSIEVPDRDGASAGVVLGFDDVAGYETRTDRPLMGATVGRVANRIGGARFTFEGVEHMLDANEGVNHLHGGSRTSFDRVLWEVLSVGPDRVRLRHVSPDGDAGYPGTLTVEAEYRVGPGELHIEYRATTDRPTPVNMTQHAYFNLAGERGGTIGDHVLSVAATRWTEVDDALIPTGRTPEVAGTAFDLRAGVRLADGIAAVAAAGHGTGFDHNLWLDGDAGSLRDVAELLDPASGRRMVLASDQPCLQVYTTNSLGRSTGRGGITFPTHGAVCLEPQYAPDSVNRPEWPSTVLSPGGLYQHRIAYRFDTC